MTASFLSSSSSRLVLGAFTAFLVPVMVDGEDMIGVDLMLCFAVLCNFVSIYFIPRSSGRQIATYPKSQFGMLVELKGQ